MPLDVGAWGIDACLFLHRRSAWAAPSGLAPVVFGPRALEQRVKCRSFYFDLSLLEDYWLRRKYHHTMSSTLVYALYEALSIVEEEGSTRAGRATSGTIARSSQSLGGDRAVDAAG